MHLEVETQPVLTAPDDGPVDRRLPWASVDSRTLALALVGAITALALLLRWIAAQESLFGDELYTFAEVKPSSLAGVFDITKTWENTPPLFFVFAWVSSKLGDPATFIRLPSVIAGTATVPVLYLLGNSIAGRRSGITAAALFAVMPFAVYYGSEAKAYAVLLFLISLSTLALLRALESKQRLGWWALYSAASALALYTHYIAGVAIVAQAGWALLTQPGRRWTVVGANAVAAIAFVPWLPMVGDNTRFVGLIEALHPLTLENILTDPLRIAIGHPYAAFDQVPGVVSILLSCLAGAIIGVALLSTRGGSPPKPSWRAGASSDVPHLGWLLVSMTAGTLALTLIYSELSESIYAPRHISTVLPYFCLVAGVAVATLRIRVAVLAAGALVLAALFGSLRMLIDYPRPDVHAAATAIADRAPPGTPVVQPLPFLAAGDPISAPLRQSLAVYLSDRYPLTHELVPGDWPKASEVYSVATGSLAAGQVAAAALRAGARPLDSLSFDGFQKVTLTRYGRGGAKSSSGAAGDNGALGAYIQEHPGSLRDYLEQHPEAQKRFEQELRSRGGAP